MRRRPLVDADAFHCLRSLELLKLLRGQPGFRMVMTGYIRHHDLNALQGELDTLEGPGHLESFSLPTSDVHFKRLRRDGVHRGEAEAIAWALGQPKHSRPVFISNDRRARERAVDEGVSAGDVLDLLIEFVHCKLLDGAAIGSVADVWEDRHQERCRPRDWDGHPSTWNRRVQSPPRWPTDDDG